MAGTALSLFIFTASFTACSSHILDIQEGTQSTSTPTQPSSTPETTPPPESTPTPTPETTPPPEPTPTPTPAPTQTAHSITVTSGEHGTISVDKTNAAAGETVTITVTPEVDYMLDVLTITDSSGNTIAISAAKTFTMPESDVTVSGTFKFARILMKSATLFRGILLNNLNAATTATRFIHSATPPESGVATYKLSADNSDVDVLAWLDGTTIKFYAEGYTDSNRKIPLPADSDSLFRYCSSLQVIDTEFFDTAAVTDMRYMFDGCENLTTLNLSGFDTAAVTDMISMFGDCENLTTLNLSGFDTAAVTDMRYMFYGCKKLETIVFSNKFLTSNVETMASMFSGCESLTSLDLSSFDTSNVTDMKQMFNVCKKLETIVFSNKFLTSNVETMASMFSRCESLTSLDLSSFNTSNVETMAFMFSICESLTSLDLSSFDTSNVETMATMFSGCESLTSLDLSNFDTSNVTDMKLMFTLDDSLTTIFVGDGFDTSNVTNSDNMFGSCQSLVGGVGTTFSYSNPNDKTYARIDDPANGNPGYFTRK